MMNSPLASLMQKHIYRVRTPKRRQAELSPSQIPTLLGYTARLTQAKWDRLKGRRNHG